MAYGYVIGVTHSEVGDKFLKAFKRVSLNWHGTGLHCPEKDSDAGLGKTDYIIDKVDLGLKQLNEKLTTLGLSSVTEAQINCLLIEGNIGHSGEGDKSELNDWLIENLKLVIDKYPLAHIILYTGTANFETMCFNLVKAELGKKLVEKYPTENIDSKLKLFYTDKSTWGPVNSIASKFPSGLKTPRPEPVSPNEYRTSSRISDISMTSPVGTPMTPGAPTSYESPPRRRILTGSRVGLEYSMLAMSRGIEITPEFNNLNTVHEDTEGYEIASNPIVSFVAKKADLMMPKPIPIEGSVTIATTPTSRSTNLKDKDKSPLYEVKTATPAYSDLSIKTLTPIDQTRLAHVNKALVFDLSPAEGPYEKGSISRWMPKRSEINESSEVSKKLPENSIKNFTVAAKEAALVNIADGFDALDEISAGQSQQVEAFNCCFPWFTSPKSASSKYSVKEVKPA